MTATARSRANRAPRSQMAATMAPTKGRSSKRRPPTTPASAPARADRASEGRRGDEARSVAATMQRAAGA